jgi:hypothetical protein
MAQATILATGTTAATSTDIVVAAGASVTVGLFTADANGIPPDHFASVWIDTPSNDLLVKQLTGVCPTTVIAGPGTFRVVRKAGTTSFGIFTES